MFSRFLIAVAAAAVVLGGSVCAKAAEVLNFGIISTESSQNLKQLWDPFLADMEKATGFKVKAFFASDYAGIIEGMRFKKVDLCWIGNKGAIQMVDRSDGSVFAQTTAADGTDGYYSLLVVNKESPLKSVDDVLKNAAGLRFSNGDPNSTSGFLVPGYYVFAKNNVDPKKFSRTWLPPTMSQRLPSPTGRWMWRLATTKPSAASKSPTLKGRADPRNLALAAHPERSAGVAQQPSESTKKKIADFIFGYGVKGDVAHAKAILEKLQWGRSSLRPTPSWFSPSARTVPRKKAAGYAEMPAAGKAERIKKIDEALDRLSCNTPRRRGGSRRFFPAGPYRRFSERIAMSSNLLCPLRANALWNCCASWVGPSRWRFSSGRGGGRKCAP
ncbi:MAG: phosphate/phosphite/phosphonate ABC transporter substrate-binding protein [Bilophila wadsworthia]